MALLSAPHQDASAARLLQRRAAAGQLRRVCAGLYTDDLSTPLETLVRRELFSIVAALAPGAIISHRSALESGISPAGEVHLTGAYRRTIALPGLRLIIRRGSGPLPQDIHVPTPFGMAHRSAEVRAVLENLQTARGPLERRHTLGPAAIEERLERLLAREGRDALNRFRDTASAASTALGLAAEFQRLSAIIGALLGTRRTNLSHPRAIARAAGEPYDAARVELFIRLAAYLESNPPNIPAAASVVDSSLAGFVESYFSNFIEGTRFGLEEAYEIVNAHRPLAYREDDSHDVIGTFNAIVDSITRPALPADFSAFTLQLQNWNRQVIFSRAAKSPGQWKVEPNRAGGTVFVAPELVRGTLRRGYELAMAANSPAARCAMMMFVVSEVHPFNDGNGRTSRLAMNLVLSNAGRVRIIIPTVFREDYLLALKALTNHAEPEPYVRMLSRAGRFSGWLDFSSRAVLFRQLTESNALSEAEADRLDLR